MIDITFCSRQKGWKVTSQFLAFQPLMKQMIENSIR